MNDNRLYIMKDFTYAIVHRDYMGVHTQMKVYDDCIMLWNDGKLPEGWHYRDMGAWH